MKALHPGSSAPEEQVWVEVKFHEASKERPVLFLRQFQFRRLIPVRKRKGQGFGIESHE